MLHPVPLLSQILQNSDFVLHQIRFIGKEGAAESCLFVACTYNYLRNRKCAPTILIFKLVRNVEGAAELHTSCGS